MIIKNIPIDKINPAPYNPRRELKPKDKAYKDRPGLITADDLENEEIDKTVNNLLDNITSANREFVDRRLGELQQHKLQLEARLEELDRLSLSRDEINSIVSDSMKFLAGLEFVLGEGLPQEKLVALRQCIREITVDKPSGRIALAIFLVPVGNLQAARECTASI
jgi:hypothetical protein